LSGAVLLLTELRFLLLLSQIAESAAAGEGNVGKARTLEVVLATELSTLHGLWDPVKSEAGGGKEEKAGGVNWLVSLHVGILAGSVVSLAEGYAWNAVGNAAEVNRGAAAKEAVSPSLRTFGALGVDGPAGIAENSIEAVLPVLNIFVVDRTSVGWSCWGRVRNWCDWDLSVVNWCGHF
jgi:hypothetical protein